jgi:serine/arginine repetitive matrix protein 2
MSSTHVQVDKPHPVASTETSVFETGTAVSPDPPTRAEAPAIRSTPSPYPRAETSPTPRLPGYIPGMPRPMTPREPNFDPDEVPPSSSSTPRATSPRIPGTDRATSPTFASNSPLRRDSTSIRQSHRAASPLFTNPGAPITSLISGVNGRFTPDRSQGPDGTSVDFGNPFDSSLLGRRRPVSPFSQGTYQSLTVSSRPSTPSNVTWKTPTSPGSGSRSGSVMGFSDVDFAVSGLPSQVRNEFDRSSAHTRDDSNISSSDLYEIAQLGRSGSLLGSRSLRSPPLPDSPLFERAAQSVGALTLSKRQGQPSSPDNDMGSSPRSTALRSPTPTQYPSRSSTPPAFSEPDLGRSSLRGSHQAIASPFTHNQSQLVLSPLANSSRSSLESAGSSYHTWEADKQDRTIPLVAALEPQPPAWHDLSNTANEVSSGANGGVEGIVQQHSGLSKNDFVAIQQRLLFAAKLKAEVSEPRERRNSLRRRRPSASQTVSQIQLSVATDDPNNV